MTTKRKLVSCIVAAALCHTAGLQAAHAGMIATESVASTTELVQVESRRAHVLATLNRADVTDALVNKGVDMDAARARIASLSDQEVLALADQLDHAPAGASGVLGAIVFIFLLLLITDILGFTKVYPFTRSIR